MLSHEENEQLTQIGPGTPMGELMRRYWIPALFSHQIAEPDSPPVRVGLLGERLVAFRDSQGRIGMLEEACPHRTASLFFGRNEECGLRCVYHGWKFDADGNCVDMPSEPPGSNFMHKIRTTAYPCMERGGMVWTYMGPPELKPPFPEFEWAELPEPHRFVSRHIQECNWLQGLEGGFDTSHLPFLHRGTAEGPTVSVPTNYAFVPTDFGFIAGSGRETGGGETFWSVNMMMMPFHKIISRDPYGFHSWVPIDDKNTMLYSVDFQPHRPLNEQELADARSGRYIHTRNLPGSDRAVENKDNNYMIDRALQASGESFTGIYCQGIQDCGIQESMGPIANRTKEHLGVSDSAIIKIRRMLLQALDDHAAGRKLPGFDPTAYRVRSARFRLPATTPVEDAMYAHIAVDPSGYVSPPAYAK